MAEGMEQSVKNLIAGREVEAAGGDKFLKSSPVDGRPLYEVSRSRSEDVDLAVEAARKAQTDWALTPGVQRGLILHDVVKELERERETMARVVAQETGKSVKEAYGETGGAIQQGLFFASEGQRLYGRTTTSAAPNKFAMTVRQPIGVAGLIIAANTPIANVAWKVFPALLCGNTAVLKPAEDTPRTAALFGRIAQAAGLPDGVLNIVQGYGPEAGTPLVEHSDVGVVSFTGSSAVGRSIAVKVGERMGRVSLELGGKNPLVVCDDADLERAVSWTLLSAFSNAGQRCASGSRIIVFKSVYEQFRKMLIEKTEELKVGPGDDDDLGPVINMRQLTSMLDAVEQAKTRGARILVGGSRMSDAAHKDGCYMSPTLIEAAASDDPISTTELFGPIACLYEVPGFSEALALANASPYGLTACIHTRNVNRAFEFVRHVHAGVAVVNGGTYGSEPHMPFGGVKESGNGTREPGTEALDVYSELKDVYFMGDPAGV